jgi:hypothetical protein
MAKKSKKKSVTKRVVKAHFEGVAAQHVQAIR